MWRPWRTSTKEARPKSNQQQRLSASFAQQHDGSVEARAVAGPTPTALVDWDGTVVIYGGGRMQLPEPVCDAAVFHNADQTTRTVEVYDILIALHTRGGNAATCKTQKTNPHAAAAIMA